MALLGNVSILTFVFQQKYSNITLQYHPESIKMSSSSQSRSIQGLNGLVTYVPPRTKDTSMTNIDIQTYLTFVKPAAAVGAGALGVGVGAATTLLAGAARFGGGQVLDVIDAGVSVIGATVGLAKGVYNAATAIVESPRLTPLPQGLADEQFGKLKSLTDAMKDGTPCNVLWDVENALGVADYVITSINSNVNRLREEDGGTLILAIDMNLVKQGTRVEII